jgi:hypothetical protein
VEPRREKKASVVSSNGDMLASYPSLGVWEVKDEEKKRDQTKAVNLQFEQR